MKHSPTNTQRHTRTLRENDARHAQTHAEANLTQTHLATTTQTPPLSPTVARWLSTRRACLVVYAALRHYKYLRVRATGWLQTFDTEKEADVNVEQHHRACWVVLQIETLMETHADTHTKRKGHTHTQKDTHFFMLMRRV